MTEKNPIEELITAAERVIEMQTTDPIDQEFARQLAVGLEVWHASRREHEPFLKTKERALEVPWYARLPLARALAYVESERARDNNHDNQYAWNRIINAMDDVKGGT